MTTVDATSAAGSPPAYAPPGQRPVVDVAPARWARRYATAMLAADAAAVLVAGVAGLVVRFGSEVDAQQLRGIPYLVLSGLVMPLWLVALALGRCYEPRFLAAGNEEFKRVANASVQLVAVVMSLAYLTKTPLARGYLTVVLLLGATGLLLGRLAGRVWVHRARRQGRCSHRVVVVGGNQAARELAEALQREPLAGLQVVAACTSGTGAALRTRGGLVPVLGGCADVTRVLALVHGDTVAVAAGPGIDAAALRALSYELEGTGVDLLVAPKLTDVTGTRISVRPVAGLPLLHVDEPELSGGRRLAKAVFDRVLATAGLLAVLPLLAALALAIRVTSSGPAFFRQERVGRGGETFTIWKLRTMYADAEERRARLAELNVHGDGGVLFKVLDDPRVTPLGRVLRKYSLDELPQLLNVVLGHMSLVGPRPPLPTEVEQYEGVTHRRLLVKPGITGLWQVSGRSDLGWEDTVRLDLHYVENWSLGLDLVVLAKTVLAVVRPRGAY